jgi:formylglycine-generating enzyme required for sulfatase activity/serine/threonine protein kinase
MTLQKLGELEVNHFGRVHKGLDFEVQREVRIYEFHERFATDADRWQRIWRDVLEAMKCQHQNLTPVYSASKEQRQVVTEWLPGDLSAGVDKPLSADDVRQALMQCLDGLGEIHRHGMVHGDVRPATLHLTDEKFVKLAFSPGLTFGGQHHRRELGNRYAAPELFNPKFGEIGAAVDLYALGVSAAHLCLGRKFDAHFKVSGATPADLENAWMQWQASPEQLDVNEALRSLPPDLKKVIGRLTCKNVAERYPTAAAARQELAAAEMKPLSAPFDASPATERSGPTHSPVPTPRPVPLAKSATDDVTWKSPPRKSDVPSAAKSDPERLKKLGILAAMFVVVGIILEPWTWLGREKPMPDPPPSMQLIPVTVSLDPVAGTVTFTPGKGVDGERQAMTGDRVSARLSTGEWTVTISAPGYLARTEVIDVGDSPTLALEYSLEPKPPEVYATRVVADPATSKVTVKRLVEDAEPVTQQAGEEGVYQLVAGRYRIAGQLEGYTAAVRDVDIPGDVKDSMVRLVLEALPPPGSQKLLVNSIGMTLALIPAGKFNMGLTDASTAAEVANDFFLGADEVTVAQFRQFVEAENYLTTAEQGEQGGRGYVDGAPGFGQSKNLNWRNPGYLSRVGGAVDALPVVQVSWNDAEAFCNWLSRKEGVVYRLPSQVEWERACRAGTTTPFWMGDVLPVDSDNYANFDAKQLGRAEPAGAYNRNPWGLVHMHGNVAEWCNNDDGNATARRPIRGGAWDDTSETCQSGAVRSQLKSYRSCKIGFRVARQVAPRAPAANDGAATTPLSGNLK